MARGASGNYDARPRRLDRQPDPDRNIFQFLATTGSRNYSGYSNPRLDLILANARKALTGQGAKTLYHAAQQIILNDRPIIYLYHPIKYAGVNTRVTGVQLGADVTSRVAFAQYK